MELPELRLEIMADALLDLYRRHMKAARRGMGDVDRKRLFSLIDDFEWAFPEVKARVDELYPQHRHPAPSGGEK